MNMPGNTVLQSADATEGTALADALTARSAIFDMTQAAEEAVLRPRDTGRWSHGLRAALATRIARLNDESDLAAQYEVDAGEFAPLADPLENGTGQGLAEIVRFMDRVAADTRNVAAQDVAALQAAGVEDADIVRLAELNAFLAYQIRVIAGLRLLKEGSA